MAQSVKNLPVMREIWVRSLGREDPLEKGMVTHSSILAWIIPWTEKLGALQIRTQIRTCQLYPPEAQFWCTEHVPRSFHYRVWKEKGGRNGWGLQKTPWPWWASLWTHQLPLTHPILQLRATILQAFTVHYTLKSNIVSKLHFIQKIHT